MAGKGLFAAKDFKSGDIITVSPTLIFPKESVSSVGADRKTIIQNYCIASEGVTNIALFPFGLGNMANHARSYKSNMELEWFWWSDEEKQNKLGTSTADLMAAPFAQVDIAYRASRDISEGEELTVDYGEDWANKWALHLASLNQWYLNSAARDLAEEDHNPPDAVVKGSEKPRFLAYMASENLFSPAWRAESDALEIQAAAVARMAAKSAADQLPAEIANEAAVVAAAAAAAEENGGVTAPVMVLPDADEDRSLSLDAAAQTTPVDVDIELLMA